MDMHKPLLILFACMSIFCSTVKAQDSTITYEPTRYKTLYIGKDTLVVPKRVLFPNHFKIQYAGAIGVISLGAGYNFGSSYEPTLMFGYLGKKFGHSDVKVFTISLKNTFKLWRPFPINSNLRFAPIAGISVNWGYTNNTFQQLPDHYPEKYYFQNKIHLAPFVGMRAQYGIKWKRFDTAAFYFELGSIDAYILEMVRTDYVHLGNILNLALGATLYIR